MRLSRPAARRRRFARRIPARIFFRQASCSGVPKGGHRRIAFLGFRNMVYSAPKGDYRHFYRDDDSHLMAILTYWSKLCQADRNVNRSERRSSN
jgi:hypothetical protein